MKRRFWVPATALCLSCLMGMLGSVSRDAMGGVILLSRSRAAPAVQLEGPAEYRSFTGLAPHPQRDVSVRYWMRGIVLLLIILLIVWLIYRAFNGWKPMIS
jgi:hypothetical protein